jgi:hypothetical protein
MTQNQNTDDFSLKIYKRYPQLVQIDQALSEFHNGQTVTTRCSQCDQLLVVTDLRIIGSMWVTCPNGCTKFHLKMDSNSVMKD